MIIQIDIIYYEFQQDLIQYPVGMFLLLIGHLSYFLHLQLPYRIILNVLVIGTVNHSTQELVGTK